MSILIVSSNPLFKEVIIATVGQFHDELIELNPGDALTGICELKPDVIIIDETIKPPYFEDLLGKARSLQKTRTIVLNPIQNEIILLDSRRALLRKADDLIEAIGGYESESHSEMGDRKFADVAETAKYRAGVITFLVSAFNKPPDASQVKRLRVIGVQAFAGLDRVPGWDGEISHGIEEISEFIETTTRLSEERVAQILEVDWSGLFGNTRAASRPLPYESLYFEPGTDPQEFVNRLAIEYAQAGLEIKEEDGTHLDSIGMELSYLGCLAGQTADAWKRGDHKLARSLEVRLRKFNREHLGKWAGEYLSATLEHAQTSYFKGFIHLSQGVIYQLDNFGRQNWTNPTLGKSTD